MPRKNQLARQLERIEGVVLVLGGQGHLKCYYHGKFVTTLSATTRDIGHRRQNELRELRKAGIPI